nr:MAG TPA: transposase [Caudoviricetes sp.]
MKNKEAPTWIDANIACDLLNICLKTLKRKCLIGELSYKVIKSGKKNNYFINFLSLPEHCQNKYLQKNDNEEFDNSYSEAPVWAKSQVEKYIPIIKAARGLRGNALINFINSWNSTNPEYKTSYPCFMKMKKRFEQDGMDGLLAKYGKNYSKTIIDDKYFEYFKNLYLVEGAPSLYSCWELTRGFAMREDGFNKSDFPSRMAFKRKLERVIPKQSIYLARYGESAWNRKYGNYIERDYSNIICGKVWVSDHAQIDVACMTSDGNVVFPWVTAWRDYKSSKWLGWLLQSGHPNSDHIFQTFYYAADTFGLPEDVIIDNGKDYRCKDFAGGRNVVKIDSNKAKATSMLAELNIEVHFALPYNAQTKPIERDFLKIKELLSKHCIGYRGGNVVERPEKLADEIKKGKIMPFDKFKSLFDDFVINVLNKKPSQGKNLKGLSPDELFNHEFKEKITTSRDALKLFCMRTSKTFTIGRNGIKDREFGITYWADWMISQTGLKVYLRRDIQNYKEAWAFKADNDEFIGTVSAVRAVAALHADLVSKDEFKEAMSIKKRNLKVAKAYIKQTREITFEEQCENYKTAYASVERQVKPRVSKIANTNMDKAVLKNKEMETLGKQDLSIFLDETSVKDEPLYLFETDKILQQELKGVANGY